MPWDPPHRSLKGTDKLHAVEAFCFIHISLSKISLNSDFVLMINFRVKIKKAFTANICFLFQAFVFILLKSYTPIITFLEIDPTTQDV